MLHNISHCQHCQGVTITPGYVNKISAGFPGERKPKFLHSLGVWLCPPCQPISFTFVPWAQPEFAAVAKAPVSPCTALYFVSSPLPTRWDSRREDPSRARSSRPAGQVTLTFHSEKRRSNRHPKMYCPSYDLTNENKRLLAPVRGRSLPESWGIKYWKYFTFFFFNL